MKYLVIGGTGTLGSQIIERLLESDNAIVRCMSRDELKQKDLKARLKSPRVEFILGDIRDYEAVDRAMAGVDSVFLVAALKHVDAGEENPEEFNKTNVQGVINVADACETHGVRNCVFSSTDKAVAPINAYGMTKALAEKILLQRNRRQNVTKYKIYRWGNVLASRGSAVPMFIEKLRANVPVPITDFSMTRFWIRIEDAVSFMLDTFWQDTEEAVMIPPIKSAPVTLVVDVIARLLGRNNVMYQKIDLRPGEKLHESLTEELNSKDGPQYTEAEIADLVRAFV